MTNNAERQIMRNKNY